MHDITIGKIKLTLERDTINIPGDVDLNDEEGTHATIDRADWPAVVARVSRVGDDPRVRAIAERLHNADEAGLADFEFSLEALSMREMRASSAEERLAAATEIATRGAAEIERLLADRDEATRKIADLMRRYSDLEREGCRFAQDAARDRAAAIDARNERDQIAAAYAECADKALEFARAGSALAELARELSITETPAIAAAINMRIDLLVSTWAEKH